MTARPLPLEQFFDSGAIEYTFKGGFPTTETIQRAYDDADFCRAIEAYKFFYPTVSIAGTWKGIFTRARFPTKCC